MKTKKDVKTIVFKSLYSGNIHISFEVSIIILYYHLYPKANLIFIGNRDHVIEILNFLPTYIKLEIYTSKFSYPSLLSVFYFFTTLFFKDTYKIDLSGQFSSFLYLFSSFQDEIFLHQPWWNSSKRKIFRLFAYINFNFILFFSSGELKIITLGRWIFESYCLDTRISGKFKKHFFWINHPYLMPVKSTLIESPSHVKKFGILGKQRAFHKGQFSYFHELKSYIQKEGGVIVLSDGGLSMNNYLLKIQSVDYIIILYIQNYKYSCSSIFVDAIAHKKPIICFSGPMSDYFFNTYGNIGFLCNDFDEMKNIIQRIIKLEYNATYSVQKNNIISASHDITNINRLLIQAKKNFPWL